MKRCEDVGSWAGRPRAQTMKQSDEVEAMLHLHALGWVTIYLANPTPET